MKRLGFIYRNNKYITNIKCIKPRFYASLNSKLENACVVWNSYRHIYIDLIERVL